MDFLLFPSFLACFTVWPCFSVVCCCTFSFVSGHTVFFFFLRLILYNVIRPLGRDFVQIKSYFISYHISKCHFILFKPKIRWNSDIWNIFGEKFQCSPLFYCKSAISDMFMTSLSYVWCLFLFWYVWKGEPHHELYYPGVQFSSSQGVVLLGKLCFRKRLGKMRWELSCTLLIKKPYLLFFFQLFT